MYSAEAMRLMEEEDEDESDSEDDDDDNQYQEDDYEDEDEDDEDDGSSTATEHWYNPLRHDDVNEFRWMGDPGELNDDFW